MPREGPDSLPSPFPTPQVSWEKQMVEQASRENTLITISKSFTASQQMQEKQHLFHHKFPKSDALRNTSMLFNFQPGKEFNFKLFLNVFYALELFPRVDTHIHIS